MKYPNFFAKISKNAYLCALMKTICRNQEEFQLPQSVSTIGVFDGVHRGHQHLIRMVVEQARQRGLCSTIVTFDRQPRQLFDPAFRPQLLTTLEEKQDIMAQLGVDHLVVLPFNLELAGMSARTFIHQVLYGRLNVQVLVTGYDHRFGHNRAEGFEDYVRYGAEIGMEVLRGDAELMNGSEEAVSSSVIRRLLSEEGRVDLMPQCLTRLYQLSGEVMPGEHIGHRLGFPTANLKPSCPEKLIPAPGVYAVWATLDDHVRRAAMMNIGTRPTFEGRKQTLEVNILDFDGDIYGQTVTLSFVARLREERRFDSPESLVLQLQKDKKEVEQRLK